MPGKIDFDKLINSQSGKTGFAVGMGPSLKPYLDTFKILSQNKEKFTFVSCNDFDIMTEISADYWVISSSVNTVGNWHQRFNKKPNTILVYADSVDVLEKDIVDKALYNISYTSYDQRHFKNLDCKTLSSGEMSDLGGYDITGKCCKQIIKNRKTIQEKLQEISNYHKHYSTGDSVALHVLALALLLGCNPIYIVGVDLDYSKGYVDGKTYNPDSFDPWMPRLINDFTIINESAKKMGVEIINLSPTSILTTIYKTEQKTF